MRTRGGFGVFDDGEGLLQRGLLWQRGKRGDKVEPTLRRIVFPPERDVNVPTWSWMAYEGAIGFLDLPLGGVDWQMDEIHSPIFPDAFKTSSAVDGTAGLELTAFARTFSIPRKGSTQVMVVSDIPGADDDRQLKCVVMGRRREDGEAEDARHYVMFIKLIKDSTMVYERVGVGFMPGKFIDLGPANISGHVKIR